MHPAAERKPRGSSILATCVAICLVAGCKQNKPTTQQLRVITHDLVSAAQRAGGRGTEIVIRPEIRPAVKGTSAGVTADDIYITVANPTEESKIEHAVDEVAAEHRLSRADTTSLLGSTTFDYRWDGQRTHTIHIRALSDATFSRIAPPVRDTHAPRLAIIIDDLGYDQAAADSILKLPYPLTLAVLPSHRFSAEIAEEAAQRGDQVILHFPMEPEPHSGGNDGGVEAVELHVGMRPEEVDRTLGNMLSTVPGAIGANNHEGSRATADPALMDAVMRSMRRRHLFFVDSRTTARTVAYNTAERDGVPAASRRVFLDDVVTREAIAQQLELAARDARTQGSAIAIGHPHPETVDALREEVPKLESQGIHLVFVSSLVH